MPNFADRVKDTSTTTGTGSITLVGSAPTGFRTFAAAYGAAASEVPYSIAMGAEWEVGYGTLSDSTTLARTVVLASSNANALVTFSAGIKDVFVTIPADALDLYDANLIPVALSSGASASANTTTLQNAINAASQATLHLPAGSFALNAVTMKPGVALRGAGKHATRLLCGSNSITMLGYTASATQWHFSIRDIGFDVNAKTGATAISLDGGSSSFRLVNVTLLNIEVQGAFAQGVDVRFCAATHMSDVFTSQAVDGIVIDNCADTDLLGCKAQNGTGIGFKVIGGGGAFDEGIRLVGCSTNGQHIGIQIDGQDWGLVSACSFTTCPGGALITLNTTNNWKFSACDFAVAGGTPAVPNVMMSAGSQGYSFVGCQSILGTQGIYVQGSKHTFSGNFFLANSSIDLWLVNATDCAVTGNQFSSTTSPWSVLESGTADQNDISGNQAVGLQVLVGENSLALKNVNGELFQGGKNGHALLTPVQVAMQAADRTGSNANTAQNIFDAAQDTITLRANKTYEFEAEYFIERSAGTTSHKTGVLFGGTVTVSSIRFSIKVSNPTANTIGTVSEIVGSGLGETTITAANTSATEHLRIALKGRFRTTAAGTLIPQFKYSAAPGGAPTIKTNTGFKIWQFGPSGAIGIGEVA